TQLRRFVRMWWFSLITTAHAGGATKGQGGWRQRERERDREQTQWEVAEQSAKALVHSQWARPHRHFAFRPQLTEPHAALPHPSRRQQACPSVHSEFHMQEGGDWEGERNRSIVIVNQHSSWSNASHHCAAMSMEAFPAREGRYQAWPAPHQPKTAVGPSGYPTQPPNQHGVSNSGEGRKRESKDDWNTKRASPPRISLDVESSGFSNPVSATRCPTSRRWVNHRLSRQELPCTASSPRRTPRAATLFTPPYPFTSVTPVVCEKPRSSHRNRCWLLLNRQDMHAYHRLPREGHQWHPTLSAAHSLQKERGCP
ncbi:hypothetical protein DQ04_12701000, partial [Trypanosoma grayi]|uniref:hypothetical protein n=1 Tax=Trypanosoma grayi TaxID=71804 RepID=UPI0004F3FD82